MFPHGLIHIRKEKKIDAAGLREPKREMNLYCVALRTSPVDLASVHRPHMEVSALNNTTPKRLRKTYPNTRSCEGA